MGGGQRLQRCGFQLFGIDLRSGGLTREMTAEKGGGSNKSAPKLSERCWQALEGKTIYEERAEVAAHLVGLGAGFRITSLARRWAWSRLFTCRVCILSLSPFVFQEEREGEREREQSTAKSGHNQMALLAQPAHSSPAAEVHSNRRPLTAKARDIACCPQPNHRPL